MQRLFILRHAKAVIAQPQMTDHDRPLAPRGLAALAEVSRHVTDILGGRPLDLVLTSTSTRTQQTVAGLDLGGVAIKAKRRLYLADVDELLAIVRDQPVDVRSLLLCGHNPGLHQLALALLGDNAPPQLRHDLPTAGLVVVDLEGEWTSTGEGSATLAAFAVPGRE